MKHIVFFLLIALHTAHVCGQTAINDFCASATFIPLDPTGNACINDSNLIAGPDGQANACDAGANPPLPSGGNDVWFTYVATGPVNTISVTPIGLSPAEKVSVTVINGNCAGGLSTNVCNSSANSFDPANVAFASFPGTQIWFYVTALEADGEFLVCINSTNGFIPPANDCNNATLLCNTYDFSSPGTIQSGIAPYPSCFNSPPVRPFWYKFTVGTSGPLEFTGFPTNIGGFRWALYDITSGCPGTEIACNSFYDPFLPFGMSSSVSTCTGSPYCPPVNVNAGDTYALMIDDTSQSGSGFDFTWGYSTKMLPSAEYTVDSLFACGSLTADFSDNSIYTPSATWIFDYGDGTPPLFGSGATLNIPSHTYGPGRYVSSLTITEPNSCSNTFDLQIVVHPIPVISFTTSDDSLCYDGLNAVNCVFSANTTNPAFTYNWAISGAPSSSATSPGGASSSWTTAGTFPVSLQVTDNFGCTSLVAKDTVRIFTIPDSPFTLPDTGCTSTDILVNYTGSSPAGATYTWSYAGGLVTSPGNPSFLIQWPASGLYTLTLTVEENGCSSLPYSDSVSIFDIPVIQLLLPDTLCEGDSIVLNPLVAGHPPGSVFTWNYGTAVLTGGNPASGSDASFTWPVSGSTLLTAYAETQEGCITNTDSATVFVQPSLLPSFTISNNQLCGKDSCILTYTGSSGTIGLNYNWLLGNANIINGASPASQGPFLINFPNPGNYPIQLSINDHYCSSDTISDTVYVQSIPTANAGPNQQTCAGNPVNLGSAPMSGYTYTWSPADFLNDPTLSDPQSTPTLVNTNDTTLRYIVSTTAGFCSNSDTVELTVSAVQQALFNPTPPQCIQGNSFNFSPVYGIVNGADFIWILGGDTLSSPEITNFSFTSSGMQAITLHVETPGCGSDAYTDSVEIKENPVVAFTASLFEGCAPLEVVFAEQVTSGPGYSYRWDFGNGIVSFDSVAIYSFMQPGTYTPSLTLTNPDNCSSTDSLPTPIIVYPEANALLTAEPLIASFTNPVFTFSSVFSSTDCYIDFGDGTGDSSCSATHAYSDTGRYTVTLYVDNAGGCRDTFQLQVEVRPAYSLYIPNAFTPNNDQINDRLELFTEGITEISLQVFDRKGLLVWKTNDAFATWNGNYLNEGDECPSGIYIYEGQIRDSNRKNRNVTGRITLIR